MGGVTPLEERVLDMMLSGDEPVIGLLREQMRRGSVEQRKVTGYGFFVDFSVPVDCPRIPGSPSFHLSDVFGETDRLSLGVGFVLFVKDGCLRTLEAHTYDELWPPGLENLVLSRRGGKADK